MATTPGVDLNKLLDAVLAGRPVDPLIAALERGGVRLALHLLATGLQRLRRGQINERRRIAAAVAAAPRRKSALRRLADRIAVGSFASAEFAEHRVHCIDCQEPLPAIAPVGGRCRRCTRGGHV
ncbi:hypothetical protein [Actinocatenispora rupis]|uniref:Uncharacterized protein n=1 Tax=Actinocatenispora rupis TaxID=519421 RepID=A0A8J3NCA3_9ACTN|nr:hypothetical protein [Actinocatenispora rupis]GID10214.1 hypothetical protein Aru02nite_11030 [Actinocatenispora rupis]